MKKNLLSIKLVCLFTIIFLKMNCFAQTVFSDGFKIGYEKGYCYNQSFNCVAPLTPMYGILRADESDDSYSDGYNRGFKRGLDDAKSNKINTENIEDYNIKQANNQVYQRPTRQYNETKSNINTELIAQVLSSKQRAIDRERAYLNSLSYAEREAIANKRAYSRRKSDLSIKNIRRNRKAIKDIDKQNKKFNKKTKTIFDSYHKDDKIEISEIKNGWHNAIVIGVVNKKAEYLERKVFFENGIISKYIGGAGFLSYIKYQKQEDSNTIIMEVGYEENQRNKIYVSLTKNKPIKLKKSPSFPTIIKFFTTARNQGQCNVYLYGKNYADSSYLDSYFSPGVDISCNQKDGVATFYVSPNSNYEFYSYSDLHEWSGTISTTNRYCVVKELTN